MNNITHDADRASSRPQGRPAGRPEVPRLNLVPLEERYGIGGKVIGVANAGPAVRVGISLPDCRYHLHVLGPTGTGKTTLLLRMILDDVAAGRGVAAFDPAKGDLIRDLLARLPAECGDRLVLIDPDEQAAPPAINLLDPTVHGGSAHDVAANLTAVMAKVWSRWWGHRTADICYHGLLTLAYLDGATLAQLPRLLSDSGWRAARVNAVTRSLNAWEGNTLGEFWDGFNELPAAQRSGLVAPLLSRLRLVLAHPLAMSLFGVPATTFSFADILDGGVLLARLPKGVIGEDGTRLVGSLLLAGLWQATTARARIPEDQRPDAAIYLMHMDFENYTLGRLLPERRNYDFDDPGYQQVMANVRSAVSELGWSRDRFMAIDSTIAERSYRDADREGNPERYGKKYSWIAFYRQAGALDDREELKPRSERLSDLGVDPSFPERPVPLPLALGDWATPTPATDEDWVIRGEVDVPDELLYPAELNGHPGPWVAVGGHLSTRGQTPGRSVWGLLATVLVAPEHVNAVREALQSRPYPGRDWIPEAPEDHYTFAGEIPWHPHFAHVHEDDPQGDPYLGSIQLDDRTLIPAEILTHRFGWEGYHSPLNDAGHLLVPSSNLSTAMQLKAEPQTFGQRAPDGTVAALPFSAPSRFEGDLLYIREDILRNYATGRTLVGLFWGERLPTPYPHDQPQWLQEAREQNAEVWRKVVVREFATVPATHRSGRGRSRSRAPST